MNEAKEKLLGYSLRYWQENRDKLASDLSTMNTILANEEAKLKKLKYCTAAGLIAVIRASDDQKDVRVPDGGYWVEEFDWKVHLHTKGDTYVVNRDPWDYAIKNKFVMF